MQMLTTLGVFGVTLVIFFLGLGLGYFVALFLAKKRASQAANDARLVLQKAELEADRLLKEAKIQAQEESVRLQREFTQETKVLREELRVIEERITRREANLDRKVELLDRKEEKLLKDLAAVEDKRQTLEAREKELASLIHTEKSVLQQIARLTQEEARLQLLKRIADEVRNDEAAALRHMQENIRARAEQQAKEIITTAIQRYATAQAAEITTTTIRLPSEDMKGRIIGREGRNIRAMEAATGLDVLVDETPETVILSGFDPLRREIGKRAIEQLLADGRIHPSRVEETVARVKEEAEEIMRQSGERSLYELGVNDVNPELVRLLGCLEFRYSYGQNVLQHSIEMANIMGMMAAELGLDQSVAKRIGIFHDIGKAAQQSLEGSHAAVGAGLLRKYGESALVYNAVAAHHGEVPEPGVYAVLAEAADAITAARPGARVESTEVYLKRLEHLEALANSFPGVEKSYAVHAGRELRVIIASNKIDDNGALLLARDIVKKIEKEIQYTGQVKVTVIRETRCVEYAN